MTIGLEVLGTRMLALIHESSVHSFATVLAIFLAGLAAGAAAAGALLSRGLAARSVAGGGWIVSGAGVLFVPPLFHAMTPGLQYAGERRGLWMHEAEIAALAAAALLPAVVPAGAVLPALMQMCGEGIVDGPARRLGPLLAANTAGAIAGPFVATFVAGPA